jgi:hypothetical protein
MQGCFICVDASAGQKGKSAMSEQLLFVGTYAIPEGKLEEFITANQEMTEFARGNEPRLISFTTYVNEAGTEATTIHIHPDSESLEFHLEAARMRIHSGVQLVKTKRVELYGNPSDRLVKQLQSMSEMSGSWPVIVKTPLHGFSNIK